MIDSNIRYICDTVLSLYSQRHGSHKADAVIEKVKSSDKVKHLLMESKYFQRAPTVKAFSDAIITSRYFILSSKETEAFATLLAMLRWQNEVNDEYTITDNERLKEMGLEVLHLCKQTELANYLEDTFETIAEAQKEEPIKPQERKEHPFSHMQMCAMLACLYILNLSCKRKFREEEKQYLKSILKRWELDNNDLESIKSLSREWSDEIRPVLTCMSTSGKMFFVSMLHRFFHLADDMPARKIQIAEAMLLTVGVSKEDVHHFVNSKVLDEDILDLMFYKGF